mgnify:CR=1 FL=1
MTEQTLTHQAALKYEVEVQDQGHTELDVPFASGTRVGGFVIQD